MHLPPVKEYIKITVVTNISGCTATTETISLDAAASRKSANAPSTSEVFGIMRYINPRVMI